MVTEPKIEDCKEIVYIGVRTQVSLEEFGPSIPRLHQEAMAYMQQQNVQPDGAPIVRYNVINMETKLDVTICWPVAKTISGNGRVEPGVLPAGRYATVLYTGDYSGLRQATGNLIDWAKASGIEWDRWDDPNGDAFRSRYESYITDPGEEPNPAKWQTAIYIKLAES